MRRCTAVLVGLLVLLTGCVGRPDGSSTVAAPDAPGTPSVRPRAEPVSATTRDLAFPADGLRDWVTYGDRAVVVEIVNENSSGPGQLRTVTWKRRAELWANPARPKEIAPASGTSSGGSFTSGGSDSGLETWGSPALFVGHTYLAVMSHTTIGGVGPREWSTLVMLPFDDGLIGDGEEYRGWDGQQATLDQVWGLTGPQFERLLTSTPIDPAVARYAARDANDKYQLSRRDR